MEKDRFPQEWKSTHFFAKCRESPVRAFRKKTPISVRRCSFVTFLHCWLPLDELFSFSSDEMVVLSLEGRQEMAACDLFYLLLITDLYHRLENPPQKVVVMKMMTMAMLTELTKI